MVIECAIWCHALPDIWSVKFKFSVRAIAQVYLGEIESFPKEM